MTTLKVDDDSINKAAVQELVDDFNSRPGSQEFLNINGISEIIVTDNPESSSLTAGNQAEIKTKGVRVTRDKKGNRTVVSENPDPDHYALGGLSQSLGKKAVWLNLNPPSGKPPINDLAVSSLKCNTLLSRVKHGTRVPSSVD